MPADQSPDQQQPISLLAMLAARYPRWTIWYGQATRHWWALPPHGEPADLFIEAVTVKDLVESIEVVQGRRRMPSTPPRPGGILFGEAETSRAGRMPGTAWPGGGHPARRAHTLPAVASGRPRAAASGGQFPVAPPPPPTPP